ncbi:MAG: DNA primase, partial [Anaerolineaceae bacterium]|nr:DNA primase [Anaerolineaceae bacterium]
MTVVDEIKTRVDLVDYVSATVKLKHSGKNYTGFCPFHSNTRTPAFVIFPETQTWRCFGQCNEGGDIFGFVMKKEGWDFGEALRFLAERAGVQLPSYSEENGISKEHSEQLNRILEVSALFYRQQMLETPRGHETLEYLHMRGLSDQTIKIFGMGHAPDGWDALIDHLKSKGYQEQLMLDAGLVSERDSGGCYDRFRNRLMIPIRDAYGKMAGFGARVLDPNDVPKYLNSPKTDVFDKGRLLYGLDAARQNIRAKNQVVIVEGYLDVIALHQAGFANAVSPMGTALTEDQFRLVKKFTRRIILALDPDAAGEKATLRGLETARQTMDQDSEIRFDARGLLHFERRLNADIRVTTLPEGKDPDEIVIENPERWEQIIANAKPIVEHVMETLVAANDVSDIKVKSEIAQQVLPLIEDVPDRVEREAYRQKLAYLIKVDERALIAPSTSPLKVRRSRQTQGDKISQVPGINDIKRSNRLLEKYCIGYLVNDPESLYLLNRNLQKVQLSIITVEDFIETDFLEVYKLITDSLEQDEYAPRDYVEMYLPDTISEAIESGKENIETGEIKADKEISEVIRIILRMRR